MAKKHAPPLKRCSTTDLEPDILESEVKWTLGSITTNKASGGDGIPVKHESVALNMPANSENSAEK